MCVVISTDAHKRHGQGTDKKLNFKYFRFEMLLKMAIRLLSVVYRESK